MEPAVGAWCTGSAICFRLRDHDQRLSSVRLSSACKFADPTFAYDARTRTWELRLPRPPVQRIEYRLQLAYRDGRVEIVCDPDNPLRLGSGYGDSSELRCAGYREPGWLQL